MRGLYHEKGCSVKGSKKYEILILTDQGERGILHAGGLTDGDKAKIGLF